MYLYVRTKMEKQEREKKELKPVYRFYGFYEKKTFPQMVKIRTEINRKYGIWLDIEEAIEEN